MKIKYFFLGLLTSLLIISSFLYYVYNSNQETKIQNEEIMFNLVNLRELNLDEFENIGITNKSKSDTHDFFVINYWATWCKPCVSEMPSLIQLSKKEEFKNIKFIFATDEKKEKVINFLKKNKFSDNDLFYLYDKHNSNHQLEHKYLPTKYIIDRKKMIAYKIDGELDFNTNLFFNTLLTITK